MYNHSVAELHTYYVMADRTPASVHNAGVCLKGVDDGKWGVKCSDPHGGVGGIIGPDGRVVSFWYDEAH